MADSVAPARGTRRHWLIERRVRVYPRLVLGVLAVVVVGYALTFQDGVDLRGQPVGSDFIAFWSAARLAVEGNPLGAWDAEAVTRLQAELYPGLAGATLWVYPPVLLVLVTPLGLLPHVWAAVVWTVGGIAAYVLALRPLVRDRRGWWLVAAFPGLWLGILQGQTQFVVAALLGGALVLLPRHQVLAGALVGLLVIKPHLALLFPVVLVAGRYWRAFVTAALVAVGSLAASAALVGWSSISLWFESMGVIRSAVEEGDLPTHKFVTPYAAMVRWGLPVEAALAVQAVIAIVVVAVVWRCWRATTDPGLRGSALVLGTFLVTPYAADYDLALLAFPIAWLALAGLRDGWLRGDRNALVVAWVLPMLAAPVALAAGTTPVPFVLGLLLFQTWRRTMSPVVVASGA